MTKSFLNEFVKSIGLGVVIEAPIQVEGGFINKLYRVVTKENTFAVKWLNPKVMERPDARRNHMFAEAVARRAVENGVNAIHALEYNGKILHQFKGNFFLVYNWCNGAVLACDDIIALHCAKVGGVLAKIHETDFWGLINFDEHKPTLLSIDWQNYLEIAKQQNVSWFDLYRHNIENFVKLQKVANEAHKELKAYAVCHCDMDIKNIMWVDDEPVVIDWESAGVQSPLIELVDYSYSWSLDNKSKMSKEKVEAFCAQYFLMHKVNIDELKIATDANFAGKLSWVEYTLKRALGIECADEQEQKMANELMPCSINEVLDYSNQKDELLKSMLSVVAQ